jgi:hypothetical protein
MCEKGMESAWKLLVHGTAQRMKKKRSHKISDVHNRVVFLPCTAMEILLLFHCYARCVSSLKTGRSSFIYLLASSSLFLSYIVDDDYAE